MIASGSIWQRFDYLLFSVSLLLILFGILMIGSATQDAIDPTLIARVPDQIRFALLGLMLMAGLSLLDYRLLAGLHLWLYLLMLSLLVMVFYFGVEGVAGAQRWINIGIRIQPSEVAKLLIIITLGHLLARRYQRIGHLPNIVLSLLHIGLPAALILIQPDLGMVTVLMAIWFTMIWGAGLPLRYLVTFMLILSLLGGVVLLQAFNVIEGPLERYQVQRISLFVDPTSDEDAYFNINQALISVGSGGLLGKGYLVGTQNKGRFLRVRHTDFIFSVIAEEFGFIGSLVTLGLIGIVLMRILRGARLAVDAFGSLLCYGVAAFIFFQTVTSIGMNLALMPVTGLTLPFISSGGTSLLSTMAGIGLTQSVIARRRRVS
ncbi:MAG: FtsW/RodA/SpoVE family cell cycle protein [Anaerolineaceae bacterium]|nr:FtsW/RodA/SpoVE family cell cycle protein [Anaerolineaceae bacterium]MDE0329263.1 FtsW/RodA/SpoVE family cell cycle protein [Anaerolineaceae bacterium]